MLGSAYGLLDRERSEVGRVGAMWVEPTWRRRGVGRALLEEVFGWARARGLSRLALWAPAHSSAAIALYSRAGFRETGNHRPLPTNPSGYPVDGLRPWLIPGVGVQGTDRARYRIEGRAETSCDRLLTTPNRSGGG